MLVRGALIAFALAVGMSPACATECKTLDQVKKDTVAVIAAQANLAKVAGQTFKAPPLPDRYDDVTAGQFHFLQGIYAMNPGTPAGLPPATGAKIATAKGQKGAVILWTRADLVCGAVMPVPDELLAMLRRIKTGKDEVEETAAPAVDEQHL